MVFFLDMTGKIPYPAAAIHFYFSLILSPYYCNVNGYIFCGQFCLHLLRAVLPRFCQIFWPAGFAGRLQMAPAQDIFTLPGLARSAFQTEKQEKANRSIYYKNFHFQAFPIIKRSPKCYRVIKKCVLVRPAKIRKMRITESENTLWTINKTEVNQMSLSNLFGRKKKMSQEPSAACGTAGGRARRPTPDTARPPVQIYIVRTSTGALYAKR